MTDDFIDSVKRRDAKEAARKTAVQRPPAHKKTSKNALEAYVQSALSAECKAVRDNTTQRDRNDTLNRAAFNLGQIVGANELDENIVKRELYQAAVDSGYVKSDGAYQTKGTINSGLTAGKTKPRDLSDVGTQPYTSDNTPEQKRNGKHVDTADEFTRTLKLIRMSTVESAVPQWIWEYNAHGMIPLGMVSIFTGRPGTGKSNATRYVASRISCGELPGIWHGTPMNVAMVCLEEDIRYVVKPALIAAGADLNRIFFPDIHFGEQESTLLARTDEEILTEALIDNEVGALFVDPIMSTLAANVDINKNNEVRAYLQPFVRIAKRINGIVVAVTHQNKSNNRDILAGMTGSSAFGEVPRTVFGFMEKGPGDPDYVMQQVKNNLGPKARPLVYHLVETEVATDDHLLASMVRFDITGPSDVSLQDIVEGNLEGEGTTEISRAIHWLRNYLLIEQPVSVAQAKLDARQQADIGERTLQRARAKLDIKAIGAPTADKPHRQAWCLPNYQGPW